MTKYLGIIHQTVTRLLAAMKRRIHRGYLWEGLRADLHRLFPTSVAIRSKPSPH